MKFRFFFFGKYCLKLRVYTLREQKSLWCITRYNGSKTMKRDHQKISTCAIKGCKILVGKAVRKNASHIKEKKICSTPILFYYKSSKAIMVGLLGQSWESLRLIKPVAESMVYISIFPASCNATRRNSPLG